MYPHTTLCGAKNPHLLFVVSDILLKFSTKTYIQYLPSYYIYMIGGWSWKYQNMLPSSYTHSFTCTQPFSRSIHYITYICTCIRTDNIFILSSMNKIISTSYTSKCIQYPHIYIVHLKTNSRVSFIFYGVLLYIYHMIRKARKCSYTRLYIYRNMTYLSYAIFYA